MQPWWWRSVAACASVLVLAGLVAGFAGAVGADRSTALRLASERAGTAGTGTAGMGTAGMGTDGTGTDGAGTECTGGTARTDPTGPTPTAARPPAGDPADDPAGAAAPPREGTPSAGPAARPAGPPTVRRVSDAGSATSLAVLPGWRVAPTQDVVEVPPGRFEGATILRRGAGTVVLVGVADPARVPPRADPTVPDSALEAEARRLADAYADLLAPGAATAALIDDDTSVADLPTRTSVRRVEGGALDGALVRVSTLAAPGRTVAVLAVVRPSRTIETDGDAADELVRTLRLERPEPVPAP